jgi:Arc/MetJ-type ribon-helix-helix transcriptional regulator
MRRGGWERAEVPDASDAAAWLAGRLPEDWFTEKPEVTVDRDEILVVGRIGLPEIADDDAAERAAAESGRITRFREETRERRMAIAREAEHRYQRAVSWGARCGATTEPFTTFSAPVMTRLRQAERRVLDTLVESGVARSRSDALGWCVRLVAEHSDDWLARLRAAMADVERVRAEGPASTS